MANGTLKNIEDVKEGDLLLAFNHETGALEFSPVILAWKSDVQKEVLRLNFETTYVDFVTQHDVLDQTTRKYVRINKNNVNDFIGHKFYNASTNSWETLISFEVKPESDYYCLYTAYTINCIANGLLTCPDDNDAVLNVYELDENLKADPVQLANDIATYGLCTDPAYAEAQPFLVKYAYIAIGKGLATYEELTSIFSYWD